MSDHQRYREWSASYVLGALEADERAEYERHLATCEMCRSEVASFAPMPGLLARLEAPESAPAPAGIADLAAGRAVGEWARVVRSRRRWRFGFAAAALAVAGLAAALISEPGAGEAMVITVEPDSTAVGEIRLESRRWGTAVGIELSQLPERERYVAWAVSADGTWEQIAAWGPTPGLRASVTGASSIQTADLDAVVITDHDRTETIATARAADT